MKDKRIAKSAYNALRDDAKKDYNERVSRIARVECLNCIFIAQANISRLGDINKLFVNNDLKGNATYPTTFEAANLIFKR